MTDRYGRDDEREGRGGRGRRQGRGYDERGRSVGMRDDDYGRNTSGGYRDEDYGREMGGGYGEGERGARQMDEEYSRRGRGMGDYGPDYGRGGYEGRRELGGRGFASGGLGQAMPGGAHGELGGQGWMGGYGQMGGRGGQYAGVGPKDYRRSDERIREEVCERLTVHGDVDASDIEVLVQDGEVTLSGTVQDRFMKRAAADCLDDISGVRDVHNQIRVRQGQPGDAGRRGTPTEQGMLSQQGQLRGTPGRDEGPGGS